MKKRYSGIFALLMTLVLLLGLMPAAAKAETGGGSVTPYVKSTNEECSILWYTGWTPGNYGAPATPDQPEFVQAGLQVYVSINEDLWDWDEGMIHELFYVYNGVRYNITQETEDREKYFIMPDGDVMLYASFGTSTISSYTVTFDTKGGTPQPQPQTVYEGSKITAPQEPEIDNGTFVGWYPSDNYDEAFDINTPVQNNLSLDARYQAVVWLFAYNATDNNNNEGGGVKLPTDTEYKSYSVNVFFTDTQVLISAQPDTGFKFVRWYNKTDETVLSESAECYVTPYSLKRYQAEFEKAWKITFDPNGGSIDTAYEYVDYDTVYTLPSEDIFTAPPGMKLVNYEVKVGTSTEQYLNAGETVTITADTTIKAQWTEITYEVIVETENQDTDKGTIAIDNGTPTGYISTRLSVGQSHSLYAYPDEDYYFVEWQVMYDGPTGVIHHITDNPIVLEAFEYDEEDSVIAIAVFRQIPRYTLTIRWSSVEDPGNVPGPVVINNVKQGTTIEDALYDAGYTYNNPPFSKQGYGTYGRLIPQPITAYANYDEMNAANVDRSTPIMANTTLYYPMAKYNDAVELTLTTPVCGTATTTAVSSNPWKGQTNAPQITIPEGVGYELNTEDDTIPAIWTTGINVTPYVGTFTGGTEYYVRFATTARFGYLFNSDTICIVSGGTIVDVDQYSSGFEGSIRVKAVHDWGNPVWTWGEDYLTATATFTCASNSSHKETIEAAVRIRTDGDVSIYTARVELDGQFYTNTKMVGPGFSYITPVFDSCSMNTSGITLNLSEVEDADSYELIINGGEPITVTGLEYTDNVGRKAGEIFTYRFRAYDADNDEYSQYSDDFTVMYNPFTGDVSEEDPFFEAVCWAYNNGIVNGTGTDTFGPNDSCQRQHFTIMLYRFANGKYKAGTKNPFVDLKKCGSTAKKSILWASGKGIIQGVKKNGKKYFMPTSSLTREQILIMLWRFADKPNVTQAQIDELNANVPDVAANCKETAIKAIAWAYSKGVYEGDPDETGVINFRPQDECTREQLSVFLMNYNTKIKKYK